MEQENSVEEVTVDELESEVVEDEVESTPELAPEPASEPVPEPAIVDDDIVTIRGTLVGGTIQMTRTEYDAKYGKNKN